MGKVIAVLQNKGGVGKTTIVCNLAAGLARKYPEKKVLIIDADGQGNQAISFGLKPDELENTLYDVLVNGLSIKKAIVSLGENLDLLPSNDDMNYYELDTLPGLAENIRDYLLHLRKALDPVRDEYDYIFIDAPPELKIIAATVMMASDELYVPFEPEAYNAHGLIQLLQKIEIYKEQYNMSPEVKGVIAMKVKPHTRLHQNVLLQVDAFCKFKGIRFLKTRIPDSVKYPEFIASARMPIVLADPNGKHAKYYYDLLEEVIGDGAAK